MLSSSTLGAIITALIASTANASPVKRDTTLASTAPASSSPSSNPGGTSAILKTPILSERCTKCCEKAAFDRTTTDSTWASQPAAKVEDCMKLRDELMEKNDETGIFAPNVVPAKFWWKSCHFEVKPGGPRGAPGNLFFVNPGNDLVPLLTDAIMESGHHNGMVKARGQLSCSIDYPPGVTKPLLFKIKSWLPGGSRVIEESVL